jgi:DNA polymerase elongation subunit (family B)
MRYLYIDIETIPSQSPEVHDEIAAGITPPGNISKAETIAQWEADKKPALIRDAIAKTSFDGAIGHICCIGWAFGNFSPRSDFIEAVDQERDMLMEFVAALDDEVDNAFQPPVVIGHNVINFDIRFLWQRAIVLGVRMPSWFPRDPKPWSGEVFDTMTAFAGARNTIGMDRLSRALGLPGKGEVDGSMVAGMWANGEFEKIAAYCRDDVDQTRAIHQKMLVAFGDAA